MQKHNREELARLGENERYVVDMGERCIAKWRCQRRRYCNEEQWYEDSAIWYYRSWFRAFGIPMEVEVAN
jgi:hypothetical protein